jgi:hypothetical protein
VSVRPSQRLGGHHHDVVEPVDGRERVQQVGDNRRRELLPPATSERVPEPLLGARERLDGEDRVRTPRS